MGSIESRSNEAFDAIESEKESKLIRLIKKNGKELMNKKNKNVELLVKNGHDTNCVDNYGLTPLHHAVNNAHERIIKFLLENGSLVNTKERETWSTPIISACSRGDMKIVNLLLQFDADVNIPEKNNFTCLHWACTLGNETLVRLLLSHNADTLFRDNTNMTPVLRAKTEGNIEIVKLLNDHFCNIHNIKTPKNLQSDSDSDEVSIDGNNLEDSPTKDFKSEHHYCCLCWERKKNVVLLWCGHVCVCLFCSQHLKECPICSKGIEKAQKIYIV